MDTITVDRARALVKNPPELTFWERRYYRKCVKAIERAAAGGQVNLSLVATGSAEHVANRLRYDGFFVVFRYANREVYMYIDWTPGKAKRILDGELVEIESRDGGFDVHPVQSSPYDHR